MLPNLLSMGRGEAIDAPSDLYLQFRRAPAKIEFTDHGMNAILTNPLYDIYLYISVASDGLLFSSTKPGRANRSIMK